ncbi:hypothetical protein B0181_07620 [Moraxella caviae]|uniref:Predicted small periplasmic lipoprotein n=1 Tax=Moraxella caviae TaxID=34060 RepID=A0A1S9ZZJ7_9GAMM|nr:lipoprotein [Moraxella caviae]OOR88858.1 hypothetical protein B0181_07620 [Moraxella caviae]STZ10221.1 Predicted small periplasmic lipoprotein [Moraxella caviae]VEW12394.1 Predicted small periplasmic lipoprotein [Moraxella caviae]
MKKFSPAVILPTIALSAIALLTACGQKGALYLPAKDAAKNVAPAVSHSKNLDNASDLGNADSLANPDMENLENQNDAAQAF